MKLLSTGQDSTLGNYRKLAEAFGMSELALKFLDDKIAAAPHGENEEVLADEGQMIHLLVSLK